MIDARTRSASRLGWYRFVVTVVLLAMTFRPTVLAATPDEELRWLGHLLLPRVFDGEHQLLLASLGDRRTRFTQRELVRGILVPFTGGILAKTEQGFVAMNQALKKRAEENA